MPELIILIVTVGVVFVNGWTDAPNAIACAVSTGAIKYRSAAWMAGICNLAGLLIAYMFTASVTGTMISLAEFGGNRREALMALCAAMCSIVIFAVGAWRFGIPTSESHAMIAALGGAALALGGGSVGAGAWKKVGLGLILSLLLGYFLTRLLAGMLSRWLGRMKEKEQGRIQILAAAYMALMHGAQDGQKFVAIFVMAERIFSGEDIFAPVTLTRHLPVILLCGLAMALGTSLGGGRIVALVGEKMVRLNKKEGVCADLGGALCLMAASIWGIPMSTTHTKTAAMMGAAMSGNKRVDRKVVAGIVWTWVITFPVCGALGWVLTRLLLVL